MEKIKSLQVWYHGRKAGTMALYKNCIAVFEYDREWIADDIQECVYEMLGKNQFYR